MNTKAEIKKQSIRESQPRPYRDHFTSFALKERVSNVVTLLQKQMIHREKNTAEIH